MTQLAAADALMSLSGHRRQQVWEAAALRSVPLLLREAPFDEEVLELPAAPEGEEIVWDYATTGLTLRQQPDTAGGVVFVSLEDETGVASWSNESAHTDRWKSPEQET